jgi:Tfp pilus assembly PilM family ATPase
MSYLSSLLDAAGPSVALEIAATRISGASVEWRGGPPAIVAHAVEPLPDGALVSSLTAANVIDRATVGGTVARVLERLGRPRRIALVVPDPVAKVSLVKFERVPARLEDLGDLIRWQVRKAAPFAIDEAQISYVAGQQAPDGREFIVSMARRTVIEEYERLVGEEGAHAGLVDIATFNVINAVLAAESAPPAGDWLLVNVAPDYATLAILRGPHLIFFRNRAADTDGTLADLVHQTAMYYEDRLSGAGFTRVLLAGATGAVARHAGDVDLMRRSLRDRLAVTIDTVDVRPAAALTDRISAAPAFLDTLAPLVGVLVRGPESGGKAAGGRAA